MHRVKAAFTTRPLSSQKITATMTRLSGLKAARKTLSPTEKLTFELVDSLKALPVVKTYTELLNIFVNGYKRIDKWNIDVGPYLYLYANNKVEGHRFRLGFRTDPGFSKKWIFQRIWRIWHA